MIAGLTGGIGSGKSTVAKLFGILGCRIFNSDEAAHCAYYQPEVQEKVKALLGAKAYLSDQKTDRAYIGSKIFGDARLLHEINAIIHPAVGQMFAEFVKRNKDRIIIKETALLFEAKLEAQVETIITVASEDDIRIRRVMQRDGLSMEQVKSKLTSQLPQEEKIRRSHFVIYNNEKEFLISQVLKVHEALCKHA